MKKILLSLFVITLLTNVRSQYCDNGFEAPAYFDTYHEFASIPAKWAHFNTHDPSAYRDGEYYYLYNTDVGMGYATPSGAMKRRSKDLVNWEYTGSAFDGVPQSARDFFLTKNPLYTDAGIWAPFITKYKDEFRLYYSAPGGLTNQVLAAIGWATSSSANGPWEDKGLIVTSIPGDTINTIDPTVVIDSITGRHWMAYGSYQTGLYIVELDSTTGGLKTPGDRGVRIAARSGGRHAAIEGPELNYHNGWYYLFVSYDWLEDYYNVRVGRSREPNGPYVDFNGVNMANYSDNLPMIEAPYRFKNHDGWQGTAHCGVYNDGGKFYMFNQARPTTSIYNMVLHVREIFWVDEWPVVSPERYAIVPWCEVTSDSIVGKWERIDLTLSKSVRNSVYVEFMSDGTIDSNPLNTWSLTDSLLTISWNSGTKVEKAIVSRAYDWENKCLTIISSGIDNNGMCYWGKKINQEAVDKFTQIIPGASYTIRNHHSNMLMELPGGADVNGTTIRQGLDIVDNTQIWRLIDAKNGYYKLISKASQTGKVIEVDNASADNGAYIKLGTNTGEDKQRFKILSNNNGYYRILTKVSADSRCIDLSNFSIVEGGSMLQWDYLSGLNQMWRFTRVDSIAVDTTDTTITTDLDEDSRSFASNTFEIYPNPNEGGEFKIDASNFDNDKIFNVSIYNHCGVQLMRNDGLSSGIFEFDLNLTPGLYIVKISSGSKVFTEKLIVN